jgi:eukaryotic-like serine/threonine-protein kinase
MAVGPGQIVGKYRIDRVLGKGAMGVVYEATHTTLRNYVAVKVLHAHLVDESEQLQRFEREATLVAKIDSPHVVRILDVDRLPSGEPYMVMERLEGKDLGKIVKANGRLSAELTLKYVTEAASGIRVAHQAGVVHRDIKPSNLFLAEGGDEPTIKVMDFGISKELGSGELTATSTMVGTPNYMAPEQIRSSRTVDGRADIWAIGVVLYRLLSGRAPFPGDNQAQIVLQVISAEPPPFDMPPGTSPELEAKLRTIVARCLKKDRSERYANIGELLEALTDQPMDDDERGSYHLVSIPPGANDIEIDVTRASDDGTFKPNTTPPKRSAKGAILALVGVGIVAAVGVYFGIAKSHDAPSSVNALPSPTSPTSTLPELSRSASVSATSIALPTSPLTNTATVVAPQQGAKLRPTAKPPTSAVVPAHSSTATAVPKHDPTHI